MTGEVCDDRSRPRHGNAVYVAADGSAGTGTVYVVRANIFYLFEVNDPRGVTIRGFNFLGFQ